MRGNLPPVRSHSTLTVKIPTWNAAACNLSGPYLFNYHRSLGEIYHRISSHAAGMFLPLAGKWYLLIRVGLHHKDLLSILELVNQRLKKKKKKITPIVPHLTLRVYQHKTAQVIVQYISHTENRQLDSCSNRLNRKLSEDSWKAN